MTVRIGRGERSLGFLGVTEISLGGWKGWELAWFLEGFDGVHGEKKGDLLNLFSKYYSHLKTS